MKFEMGRQPFRRQGCIPATCALLACLVGLAGCSPANFFHQREGGEIAKPQQPTPGANQPYPNLASVPPAPAAPNQAELSAITNGLIADRAHAQYLAEGAPLPDPSSPQASPGLFGVGTASPPAPPSLAPPPAGTATASLPAATAPPLAPSAGTATASLPAATAPPPAPVRPPARAPVAAVQSTPLPAIFAACSHAWAGAADCRDPACIDERAHPVGGADSGAEHAVAHCGPSDSDCGRPWAGAADFQRAARAACICECADPGAGADHSWREWSRCCVRAGSAALTEGDVAALKSLAARRGNKVIEALGRGDGVGNAPAAQAQAVTLGFARAQAIAKALRDSGVPENAIQVMSFASGRGGAAQLVE